MRARPIQTRCKRQFDSGTYATRLELFLPTSRWRRRGAVSKRLVGDILAGLVEKSNRDPSSTFLTVLKPVTAARKAKPVLEEAYVVPQLRSSTIRWTTSIEVTREPAGWRKWGIVHRMDHGSEAILMTRSEVQRRRSSSIAFRGRPRKGEVR